MGSKGTYNRIVALPETFRKLRLYFLKQADVYGAIGKFSLISSRLICVMASKSKKPEPLTAATVRNLNDKLYDKRKLGAVEVEIQVRDLTRSGTGHEKLMEILTYLQESFIVSGSTSSRKGGLIAFAAAALGLGGVRNSSIFFGPNISAFEGRFSSIVVACRLILL